MDMEDAKWTLQVQLGTSRTKTGRRIGESLLPLIENSLANPGLAQAKMAECPNCHLVLDEEYFFDGCRNCGYKGDFESGKAVTKEK